MNAKLRDEHMHTPDNNDIDYEVKEAKCNNYEWESENFQYRPDDRMPHSKKESCCGQHKPISGECKAGNVKRGDVNRKTVGCNCDNDFEYKTHRTPFRVA